MSVSQRIHRDLEKRVQTVPLREVSRESGVNVAVLSRWLSDPNKTIHADTIDRLARYLGLGLRKK